MTVPGTASTAETASEHANDFLIRQPEEPDVSRRQQNSAGIGKHPRDEPDSCGNQQRAGPARMAPGSAAGGSGRVPPDSFSPGQIKKETPNPATRTSVRTSKVRAPVNFVRAEPRIVAGTPTPTLHQKTCQSSSRCLPIFRGSKKRSGNGGRQRRSHRDESRVSDKAQERCRNGAASLSK